MSYVHLVVSVSLLLIYIHICKCENKNSDTKTTEGTEYQATKDPEAYLEEMEKKKWQVKRLWDADFVGDTEDTNNARYSYRESLRKDASTVQYVTAEGLPVDQDEIKQSDDDWIKQQPSRRGDYVIDTEEYDEEIPFDPDKECPGNATVIELNLFQPIIYDLACRQMVIWNVLESQLLLLFYFFHPLLNLTQS